MSSIYEKDRKGRVIKNRQGKVQMKEIRENGRANLAWLDKHKLTPSSLPSDCFEALLPLKGQPGDPASLVTIGDWTTLTNKKAMLADADVPGGVYHDWKPFSPVEVRRFIALYMLQGLSPSPQIKMKFEPHNEDPINGSNMCFKVFGRVGDRRHRMFKAFLHVKILLKLFHPRKLTLILKWTLSLLTFRVFQWKPGIWGGTSAVMSRQLVSRETMQTNRGSVTKKKGMDSWQTHCVKVATLTLFT
jgi:hypothetical protein